MSRRGEAGGSAGGLRFELRLALRYLTPRRREGLVASVTGLCTAGVFVGVGALVVALAFMSGLQGHVKERLLSANPHVVVRPGWGQPDFTATEAESIAETARSLPAVVSVAPFFEAQGLLRSKLQPQGRPVLVKGVDPEREDGVTGLASGTTELAWSRLGEGLPAGAREPERGGDEGPLSAEDLEPPPLPAMLVGQALAFELGVMTGDVVHLVSTEADLWAVGAVPRSRAYRVVGLLTTGVSEYDRGLAVVHLGQHAAPGGEPLAGGVQVAVRRPLRSAEVAAALAARLPGEPIVTDWTTTFSRLFAAFRWEKIILVLALGLIGVVAGFNIFTILTMNVMARVEDIGVLSALGARSRSIVRIFTLMGLGIGGTGTLVGLTLGSATAVLLDRLRLIRLDEAVYLVSHVPFQVRAMDLGIVGAGMLLVSYLSTIAPARTAARVDPVVALRAT